MNDNPVFKTQKLFLGGLLSKLLDFDGDTRVLSNWKIRESSAKVAMGALSEGTRIKIGIVSLEIGL